MSESAEIEREIEETRARLDETLMTLQRKLSPEELVDGSLAYLRERVGPARLGEAVKRHPLPVLLIALGVGWFVLAARRELFGERPAELGHRYPPPAMPETATELAVGDRPGDIATPAPVGRTDGGFGAAERPPRPHLRPVGATTRDPTPAVGAQDPERQAARPGL